MVERELPKLLVWVRFPSPAYLYERGLAVRLIIWAIFFLFLVLQYALWFSPGGIVSILHLRQQISAIKTENTELEARNALIAADVADLKQGKEAIEERARNDLGMIKNNETFYQTVDESKK